jgi:glycosyltransferase involved in cell wall biosynthesis
MCFYLFVNCSKQESFGVNILEAMSCELPVIATDCVGPRELIEDGVSGIIVKDRKPESMAAKIIELLQNKELRIKLGNEGRKRVLERYNWEKNVEELESLLSRNRLKN